MYEIYSNLRDLKGLSDADVARICNFSKSTLSDWKSGKCKNPNANNLLLIANCLGTTVEYLMTGKDVRIPAPIFEEEHVELITLYSQLEKEQKDAVFNLLRSFCSK